MDYKIRNKFADAIKFAEPPCDPIQTSVLLTHLRQAAQSLYDVEKSMAVLRNRQMYISCLESYFEFRGVKEVIPDEAFFRNLAHDLLKAQIKRKECVVTRCYNQIGRRRVITTVRYFINNFFCPRNLTFRVLKKLVIRDTAKSSKLPPPSPAFSSEEFVRLLHEANRELSQHKETAKIRISHIRIFDEHLRRNRIESFVPDETFLLECLKSLESQPLAAKFKGSAMSPYYSEVVKTRAVREIRILANRYFYPNGIIKRPILLEVTFKRYNRFFALTPNTQRAIAWFEENGKAVKAIPVFQNGNGEFRVSDTIKYIYRVTGKRLLPGTASGKINMVMNFLETVGKRGIEEVDESDLTKYIAHLERRQVGKFQDYLAHTATFFINAQAEGFVKDNPFKKVSLKMNVDTVRVDFIPKEGIEVLLDIASLDYKNTLEIRNAVACLLGYDTGLRRGELYGLNVTDVKTDNDGDLYLSLDETIQKGHKPKNITYLLFDQTKELLRFYLEKGRPALKPKDNALFISRHDKKRLCLETLSEQMNHFMHQKGIRTFYKQRATAHHLRHSLATLNVDPLGLGLSLHQIVERLRHSKYETAQKHYIHSNPYLQKQKYEALKNRLRKKSNRDILKEIPLTDFEAFLSEDMQLDPELVKLFRKKYRNLRPTNVKALPELGENGKLSLLLSDGNDESGDRTHVSAETTEKRIASLGLHFRKFRKYCSKHGLCIKRGRETLFKESFLDELLEDWVRKEEVVEAFGLSRSGFYRLVEGKKWPVIKIGKVMLVKLKKLLPKVKGNYLSVA